MNHRRSSLPPQLRVDGPLSAATLKAALPDLAPVIAARMLPDRRWFGDKTRRLTTVTVADAAIEAASAAFWLSILVDLAFADGGTARYFIPLAVTGAAPPDTTVIASLVAGDRSAVIVDAFAEVGFRRDLLDQLGQGRQLAGRHGAFAWQPARPFDPLITAAASAPNRISAAEQSNTSVIYGDRLILKVFRKIQPGINPEIELGRFLTSRTSFRHMPSPFGDLVYLAAAGEPESLAVAQSFVPSRGDGWSFTLEGLAAAIGEPGGGSRQDYAEAAEILGRRTGELHTALASDPDTPAFAPEPVTRQQAAVWRQATCSALADTSAAVAAHGARLDPSTAALVRRFREQLPRFERQTDGYFAQVGTTMTRVHGDYHLGQTLRTLDDDFVILDFEGEPARSLAERRAKTSPLKDVAGMLRSLSYARGAAARAAPADTEPASIERVLAAREEQARAAFLAGYLAETAARGASFVPTDPAAFTAALTAWELDKALYEIRYELNHRPDWLAIPLGGLVAPSRHPDTQ